VYALCPGYEKILVFDFAYEDAKGLKQAAIDSCRCNRKVEIISPSYPAVAASVTTTGTRKSLIII
jgi:hypothetical protein